MKSLGMWMFLLWLGIVAALGSAVLSFAEEGCKVEAKPTAKAEGNKPPIVNTYKCDKTGKTWTQPASQKKTCPFCGAAATECGTLVKSEPDKIVYTCKLHKFICEEKPGRCKVCNLKLIETFAGAVPKKTRRTTTGELVDVSKEPDACDQNER